MSVEELYRNKVEKIACEVAEFENVEVLEVKFLSHGKKRIFQVFIYSPQGISIDKCTSFSKKMSSILDEDVMFLSDYNLEVSSPGLYFTLTSPRHYEIFNGKRVKYLLKEPVEGKKQGKGILEYEGEGKVSFLGEDGNKIETNFFNIKKCSLNPNLKF
jgi:ribosome maturation factor RimP